MTEVPEKRVDKNEIIAQIADLSKLLRMIPGNETIPVNEPLTQKAMVLSKWFDENRKSFLKLSILLNRTLDLNLP